MASRISTKCNLVKLTWDIYAYSGSHVGYAKKNRECEVCNSKRGLNPYYANKKSIKPTNYILSKK